jgi:hypothetical protein
MKVTLIDIILSMILYCVFVMYIMPVSKRNHDILLWLCGTVMGKMACATTVYLLSIWMPLSSMYICMAYATINFDIFVSMKESR